jgi:Holliday junction resolvasome RuvABC DNA-binding subunit
MPPSLAPALVSALRNLGYPAAPACAAAEQVLSAQPHLPLDQALRAALAALRPQ